MSISHTGEGAAAIRPRWRAACATGIPVGLGYLAVAFSLGMRRATPG